MTLIISPNDPLPELTIAAAEEAIRRAILQFPTLSSHGLTDGGFGTFETARQYPLRGIDAEHVFVAVRWLRVQPRTKRVNRRTSTSYGLKHDAESDMGQYLANGAFIVAAHWLEFKISPETPTSPNAYLNISWQLIHPPKDGCLCTGTEPPAQICENCRRCRSPRFHADQALWDRLWWDREVVRERATFGEKASLFRELPMPRRLPAFRNADIPSSPVWVGTHRLIRD